MSVLVYCSFLSIFSIKIFDWGLGGMYHYNPKILRQSCTDGKVVVNILQKKLRQISNRNTANSLCPLKSKLEVDRAQIEPKSYI